MDKIRLILASKSPRRQALVNELGIPFEVRIKEVDEVYPAELAARDVPEYLARLKAEPLRDSLASNEVLLTSDTVVVLDDLALGKPSDEAEAFDMLQRLSGKSHEVITGVSLISREKEIAFASTTHVSFAKLTPEEIRYYIRKYQPMDKAGAYGIQEWIGYIGVEKIEGCYYNVMGLPLHDVYHALKREFGLEL